MKIETKLAKMLKESDNELEKYVIEDILSEEQPEQYLKDLLSHGCISGMCKSLIYYTDTANFFIKFENEINDIKEEFEESTGEPLKIGYPITNWLAWFAYEEMASKIASELNLN